MNSYICLPKHTLDWWPMTLQKSTDSPKVLCHLMQNGLSWVYINKYIAAVIFSCLAMSAPAGVKILLLYRLVYFLKDGCNPTLQLSTIIPPFDFAEWKGIWLIFDSGEPWSYFRTIFNLAQAAIVFIYQLPLEFGLIVCGLIILIICGFLDRKA